MLGFGIVVAVLLLAVLSMFQNDFKAVEKEWGQSAKSDYKQRQGWREHDQKIKTEALAIKIKRGWQVHLTKETTGVWFQSLITIFPTVKHLTCFILLRTTTQSLIRLALAFEIDSLMPDNDLFRPNPFEDPFVFCKDRFQCYQNTHAKFRGKLGEVYKVLLSPWWTLHRRLHFFASYTWLPTNTKTSTKVHTAQRCGWSDLNSAYFIYNPAGNKTLEQFQKAVLTNCDPLPISAAFKSDS